MRRPHLSLRTARFTALTVLVTLLVAAGGTRPAAADWPSNPLGNLLICNASNFQLSPEVASDGAGGAIIAWADLRSGTSYDVYAQHVLASGAVDPAWPNGGRAVSAVAGDQAQVKLVGDGAGGAILVWVDRRIATDADLYAQHVLASGVVDPGWPAGGLAVCMADSTQYSIVLESDGSGGVVVAWLDIRSRTDWDVYAQHVLAAGNADPAWPANGLAVCNAPGNQASPSMTRGASGSVIVAWGDSRGGASDVYAQRVLANGTVDPGWPTFGAPVSVSAGNQFVPDVAGDGAGGAFVVWHDYRAGTQADIYAAHLLATGVLDPTWPPDGKPLCTNAADQTVPRIVATAPGEAIACWMDGRSGLLDVYATSVTAPAGVWPTDGRALSTAAGDQRNPKIIADGTGGAIACWQDRRIDSGDIYAQHVLVTGLVDPAWPVNGAALCTAASQQQEPRLLADGAGGLIAAWMDTRSSAANDIYAQRVQANGQLGGTVVDVPAGPSPAFALGPVHPNPARGGSLSISFSLPGETNVSVELLDLTGRRLATRALGMLTPGTHSAGLDVGGRVPAGVYFVRVLAGTQSRGARISILD